MPLIDLRSDTVTKPSARMRTAMAVAEVGDDVYGEDLTVNKLELRAAERFGREAALFVPTGTMGNQIAIRLHTRPGQEVIAESRAHILDWEMATTAVFSGCLIRAVEGEAGLLDWARIAPHVVTSGGFHARTGLIELENTANMAGGRVYNRARMEEIIEGAHGVGLPVHLDGARIFNAAVALGVDVRELTRGFDTVMFCLSKGLGAPVGSLLVGSRALIDEARILRKAMGGGMRQAGILAAAGLIALEEGPHRLHEDHENARLMADALAHCDRIRIDPATVETNIVIFELASEIAPAAYVAALKEQGILVSSVGGQRIRLVTHLDVSRAECELAAKVLFEKAVSCEL